jgi:hypothetical protein
MSDLGLQLPLRIVAQDESVKVIDAGGRVAAYVYTSADHEQRLQTKRLSPEEGIATAKVIARALTVELEWRSVRATGDSPEAAKGKPAAAGRAG